MNDVVPQENLERRAKLMALQELVAASDPIPAVELTAHHFAPGVYMRQFVLPAAHVVVGKIHKLDHLAILLSGEGYVATEHGTEHYVGPCVIKSSAGIKRSILAITEMVWLTIHPNPDDEQDLTILEAKFIAKDYSEIGLVGADEIRQVEHT